MYEREVSSQFPASPHPFPDLLSSRALHAAVPTPPGSDVQVRIDRDELDRRCRVPRSGPEEEIKQRERARRPDTGAPPESRACLTAIGTGGGARPDQKCVDHHVREVTRKPPRKPSFGGARIDSRVVAEQSTRLEAVGRACPGRFLHWENGTGPARTSARGAFARAEITVSSFSRGRRT